MKKYLRGKLINFLAKDLYNTITEGQLMQQDSRGRVYIAGKALSDENDKIFKEDAERFQKSTLWKLLSKELEYHAVQQTLHSAKDYDDVVSGKILIYIINTINKRLSSLKPTKVIDR